MIRLAKGAQLQRLAVRGHRAQMLLHRPAVVAEALDALLKQPHDPGRKVSWPVSRFQYARTELPANRYKFSKTATHSGLPKPFHTTPGLEGNLTGPNYAIDRPPKPILKVV